MILTKWYWYCGDVSREREWEVIPTRMSRMIHVVDVFVIHASDMISPNRCGWSTICSAAESAENNSSLSSSVICFCSIAIQQRQTLLIQPVQYSITYDVWFLLLLCVSFFYYVCNGYCETEANEEHTRTAVKTAQAQIENNNTVANNQTWICSKCMRSREEL